MKAKILRLTISVLLLFCAYPYTPAHGVSVKTAEPFALQETLPAKVINHASFVQIPKQLFEACVKINKAFQTELLVSFSTGETAFKTPYKVMNFNVFFDSVNLGKTDKLEISYMASRVKCADNPVNNVNAGLLFAIFGILQLLLCLLAVKKANLPYAININVNPKPRYLA